jgi:hypothetical protein
MKHEEKEEEIMPRGGARPGSGRKTYNISEKEKKKLLSRARKMEKETGRGIADILLDFIYQAHKYPQLKLTAIKLYYDIMTVSSAHKTIEEHKYEHGIIILPEIKRPEDDEVAKA